MKSLFRELAATSLVLMLLSTRAFAYADIHAFSKDDDAILASFADEYGWDREKIKAAEWSGVEDGHTYRRSASYQKEYYEDLLKGCKEYCVENNIIKASNSGGFGGRRIAKVARAEVDAPDSMEIPMGSNRTKYNDWFYDRAGAEAPWCAIFVSWCADQCGLIDSGLYHKDAGVTTTFSYMTEENGFQSYTWREVKQLGGGSYSAVPGDLFFFEGMGHIGIVTEVSDTSIEVTHGNSSDNNVKATLMSPSGYFDRGTIVHVEYGLGSGAFSGDSVEEAVFYFLVEYMELPISSSAGVLANIDVESGHFNVTAVGDVNIGGSYGLCQWHAERWTSLINFCDSNGYDWESLEGQLFYLQYEITEGGESHYGLYERLLTEPENSDGAYDAGYHWCFDFERPDNTASEAFSRACLARDVWYPKYVNVYI